MRTHAIAIAFAYAASALQHTPHRCRYRQHTPHRCRHRRRAVPDDDDAANAKWSVDVDEFAERLESGKAAVVGGLAASIAAAPVEFLTHANNIPQFEFDVDQISIMGALFGLVFRYAVRRDANPQLRQGSVGAFAITRAVATVHVSDQCLAVPLRCGAPLSYLDYAMLGQLASGLVVSGVAFTAAAAAIDAGVERGWLKRFP
jgi:hypothetical protein